MSPQRLVTVSKYLSKHLRHAPGRINLQLDSAGWADVEELLAACARHNFPISRDELREVVASNNKQRFAWSEDGTRIRANQGHSIAVDLGLQAQVPPDVLYHGTAVQNLETICREGLRPMRRHHVHLSRELETAWAVGARHGKPVVLRVDAAAMQRAGALFLQSKNGVWLTDYVPPQHFRVLD